MAIKVYKDRSPFQIPILLRSLLDFIYPRYCAGCRQRLSINEWGVCPSCFLTFPRFNETINQACVRIQAVRYPIDGFLGGYCFEQLNHVQTLIHNVKYHRHKEAAWAVGKNLAQELGITSDEYDLIVPVPITLRREIKRGYNQSFIFAQGISMASGIPVAEHGLQRQLHTASQTKRKRRERQKAMEGIFQLGKDFIPPGSRILLLDDVLTTGSTLTAAANALAETLPRKMVLMTISVAI